MKKALTIVLVLALALCSVFAGDFKFLFTELDQHPEILAGFLPTLTAIGVGYNGLDLIDGNLTQVQFTVGGGFTQRVLFQNPVNGEPLITNQLIYDDVQLRWNLKFLQGFGDSPVEGLDLITTYIGYEGRYELAQDSHWKEEMRLRGYATTNEDHTVGITTGVTEIGTMDQWYDSFGTTNTASKIYPDLNKDDYSSFINNFYIGAKLNLMDDRMVSNEGMTAEVKLQGAWGKQAKYYTATVNFVAGTTLFEIANKKGLNLFSMVLIGRANATYTDGPAVPVYASRPVSLGRKVRGIDTNSYNTNFSAVANIDLRLAGPEFLMDGVFPRLNIFLDLGYHAGNYLNTGVNGVPAASAAAMAEKYGLQQFLCTTGFQLEMCFFDFIDLGFQLSYLINGENLKNPQNKFITGATFFLDF